MRRLSSAVLGGALLLSLGGCLTEDENTQLVFGPDSAVTVAPLVTPGLLFLPKAEAGINRLLQVDFDLSQPDAFGRATSDSGFNFSGSRYLIDPAARNRTDDPRLPALGGLGTEITGLSGTCRFGASNFWFSSTDPGFGWDFFCFLDGLKPTTDYSVLLYRYAVDVRGQLDTPEMLLAGAITQPDSLYPLGGTPGGYPTEACDFSDTRPTYTIGVTGDQNPLNMGFVTTDAAGGLVFDCLIGSGGFWADNQLSNPDSAPFAPNRNTTSTQWQYNYVVILEGVGDAVNPIPAGEMVMRFQVGADLDANGDVVFNSYAPIPTAALTAEELALSDFAQSVPDSVQFSVENLSRLGASAGYQLWAEFDDGSTQALEFTYANLMETDTGVDTIVAPETRSSFVGGPGVHEVSAAYPGGQEQEELTFFFTVESSAGATTPSAAQAIWMDGGVPGEQGFGVKKSLDVPELLFGTRGIGGSSDRLYAIAGSGSGGLFGDEFRERYQHLPRPPVAYKYVAWLSSGDTLFEMLPDASFTSPPPEYAMLEAADVDLTISPVVQPLEILEAMTRICLVVPSAAVGALECAGPFDLGAYDKFILSLEPKVHDTSEAGPTWVLEGLVPTPRAR